MKLHRRAAAFKRQILSEYELNPDEKEILIGACESLSQFWRASEDLATQGLTFETESGQLKANPSAGIAKNAWGAFLAGCRLLQIGAPAETKNRVGRPSGGN